MSPEVVAVAGFGLVSCAGALAALFRALHQRDQARLALGLARMELLETRNRWVACHRRVLELERGGKPMEVGVSSSPLVGPLGMLAAQNAAGSGWLRAQTPMEGGRP